MLQDVCSVRRKSQPWLILAHVYDRHHIHDITNVILFCYFFFVWNDNISLKIWLKVQSLKNGHEVQDMFAPPHTHTHFYDSMHSSWQALHKFVRSLMTSVTPAWFDSVRVCCFVMHLYLLLCRWWHSASSHFVFSWQDLHFCSSLLSFKNGAMPKQHPRF